MPRCARPAGLGYCGDGPGDRRDLPRLVVAAPCSAPCRAEVGAGLDAALAEMLAPFAEARGFVHRDYFPANLMRLQGRSGPRRTGILDFQDAAIGHPAYDLISLVEDARRDVAPATRRAAVATYLAARPGLDRGAFLGAMAACGAQRHLRVAALWVRLARRDAKPGYLIHGPRCWAFFLAGPIPVGSPPAPRCGPSSMRMFPPICAVLLPPRKLHDSADSRLRALRRSSDRGTPVISHDLLLRALRRSSDRGWA